jgi:cytochrome c-type biogenesis protein CcmE
VEIVPERKRAASRGKTRFFAGGALILVAIITLIANGIRSGGHYYLTLDELAVREATLAERGVRVNAMVDKESVHYDSRSISLTFDLVDEESSTRRHVIYNQPMPDLFMNSESVIVEGVVNSDGALEAHTILVKCPSKYEEAQENGEEIPLDHYLIEQG